jgi:hypothetical protein
MRQYTCLCRYKDEAGSGFGWAFINATNPFEAYQFLKSQYGRLLMTEYAIFLTTAALATATFAYISSRSSLLPRSDALPPNLFETIAHVFLA